MKKIILLFLVAVSVSAYDVWGEDVLNHIQSYKALSDDPFVHALKGSCREPKGGISAKKYPGAKLLIPHSLLLDSNVKAYINLSERKDAPAVFFIPGSFGNANEKQPNRIARNLLGLGYSVIRLPNPYSRQFINAEPNFWPGNFIKEAQVLYHAIKRSLSYLKYKGYVPNKVVIAGVSQGAFISSVIMNLDINARFIDQAVLFSPPYNLGRSIELMEQNIDDTKSMTKLIPIVAYAKTLFRICKYDPIEVTTKSKKVSKFLVSWSGFQDYFADSIRLYTKRKDIDDIAPSGKKWWGLSPKYRKWKQEFRFSDYMREHAPEVHVLLNSEQANLMYWVDLNKYATGKERIRVITSNDDFINDPDVWPKNDAVLMIPKGSHYGYRANKWFDIFVEKIFNKILSEKSRREELNDL